MSTSFPALAMTASDDEGSIWDQFQKFWGDAIGGGNAASSNNPNNNDKYSPNNNGIYQIASLPVQSIKLGGLRLFLMLYLMGMQNTPQPKTWRAHQPTTTVSYDSNMGGNDEDANNNKHVLEMYFHDQTALFRVRLTPNAVVLERQGPTPSTAYLMQETLLVDGIWNELQVLATQADVPEDNRLVLLSQPQAQTAMDQARDALSFG